MKPTPNLCRAVLPAVLALPLALPLLGCAERASTQADDMPQTSPAMYAGEPKELTVNEQAQSDSQFEVIKTDEEWRKELTPEQYRILRQQGTERAFTGKYWNTKTPGKYICAACGQVLYVSDTKFDSGCGWPSFYDAKEGAVDTRPDNSLGMQRTEIICSRCGSHLGHVFTDGPAPTGLRHCVNSASLELVADEVNDNDE